MKAILVIDMPKNCAECQFCGRGGRNLEKYVCCLTREHSEDIHLVGCPLKPLPKKILTLVRMQNGNIVNVQETSFANGWNAYYEELTGEETE